MRILIPILSLALLAGCLEESMTNKQQYSGAAITLKSSDYSSSDIGLIDTQFQIEDSFYPQAFSDTAISIGSNSLYLLNRYGQNNIIKFSKNEIGTELWQYSTQGNIEDQESNPYTLVEKDNSNAYIIRYGSGEIWHVNPSSETDESFFIDSIDISQFDEDGIPEMADALIHQGVLYVILQRQTYFQANASGLLIAINTQDNSLVDLDPNSASMAYTLKTANPNNIQLSGNSIYISSRGKGAVRDWSVYPAKSYSAPPTYNGGIEAFNLNSQTSELILDDGDQESAPYGQIKDASIHSNDIVFTGYDYYSELSNVYVAISNNSVIELDETLADQDIHFSKFDDSGNIWIGIGGTSDHHIRVYEKSINNQYQLVKTIQTSMMPTSIVFN